MTGVENQFFGNEVEFLQQPSEGYRELARDALIFYLQHQLKEAKSDSLTGLPGRKCFDEDLPRFLVGAEHGFTTVGLAYIDIDNLKEINDQFGHLTGDMTLRAIAESLRRSCRLHDNAYRIGGDEFALILNGEVDEETGSLHLAEDIRTRLKGRIAEAGQVTKLNISASVGVTFWQPGEAQQSFIHRADQLMYTDKRQQNLSQGAF